MAPSRYGSWPVSAEPLGQSMKLPASGRVVKNRLLKSPMAEGMATWSTKNVHERGIPTDELVELYRRWGEGKNNWGVIVTGNIDTQWAMPNGAGDMMIAQDCPPEGRRFEKFKELASAAKAHGSLIVGQITHPGRQVKFSLSPVSVSASDVQLAPRHGMEFGKPHAATKDEIEEIANDFAHTAEYLEKAGFDGVELHAAHGYLISQFLSRTTNLRTDEYGVQTVENRLRFLSDIVRAVKSRVSPGFVVAAKLNSVEFQEGGVTADEARAVVEGLEKMGLDYVQLSGGTYEDLGMNYERDSTKLREGFFLKFARIISDALGDGRKIKMYIAGGMLSVEAMVNALDAVDGVALGRPAAAEPRLSSDIIEGRVSGAIKHVSGIEGDMNLTMAAAQAQLWQIARGKEPFRLDDAAVVAQLQKDMGVWHQKTMEDAGKHEFVEPLEFTGPETAYGEVVVAVNA